MTQDQAARLARIVADITALALDLGAIVASPIFRPAHNLATLETLISAAAFTHGVQVEWLTGKSRRPAISNVRQAIMAEASDAGYTDSAIGRALGNRDPSTIREGITSHRLRAASQ